MFKVIIDNGYAFTSIYNIPFARTMYIAADTLYSTAVQKHIPFKPGENIWMQQWQYTNQKI